MTTAPPAIPTLWHVEAKVREFAALAPTFRYQKSAPDASCDYAPDGLNPLGCIIGAALADLGIELPHEGWNIGWGFDAFDDLIATSQLQPVFRDDAAPVIGWLAQVQEEQDNGVPWAEAVKRADYLAERGEL